MSIKHMFLFTMLFSFCASFADDTTNVNMAKAAGGLLFAGFTKWGVDQLSKKDAVREFSEKTGVDA